ncbi:MAG TPA: cation-translocating P-type ATPase [Terriglobales bacterium]|jgi:heavy metal translocating P-type ATPase|nr:cation-translocating P-type ATPase [Terriglobales bacterium]
MEHKRLDIYVANLDCENEAAVITRGLKDTPGIFELRVYPKAAKVTLEFDPAAVSPDSVRERLRKMGFPPQQGRTLAAPPKPWRNAKVLTSATSGLLLLVGWLAGLAGGPESVSLAIYLIVIMVGGYFFGREAIQELFVEHEIGIELLMTIAAITAAAMGQGAEGAMLVFLYSISEAAEGYTQEKTRSAVRALMDLTPKTARVQRDSGFFEIPAGEIQVGDLFVVRPGEAMPTDGEVESGSSSVDQSPVTGESVPLDKSVGDAVYAGSINGTGALHVRATKAFAENTISRIIQMVQEAQEKKGKRQRFVEQFGKRYSPAVLALGIAVAIAPPLLLAANWTMWLTRATVLIVAAAPCALVISIPITLVAALGAGARKGVLIKGGLYVEELAKITVIALDKTGTITRGEPAVTDVMLLGSAKGPLNEKQFISVAAGIEQNSEHPLARAIVEYAAAQNTDPVAVNDFRALPGVGASASLDGSNVYVGSPAFFRGQTVPPDDVQVHIERLQADGKTVVLVGTESSIWGLIAIRDQVRANASQVIAKLHAAGVRKVAMLTGDNFRSAQAIAKEVGIDEVFADLKPHDKVLKVRELAEQYGHVAMVGDGVNDAPALAEATVGIAMGTAGSDVALETADVALMADDLESLLYALQLARRNQRIVHQNLALSAIVIAALVVGAIGGWFTLPIAVLGHEISEFIVIGSGLRMLRA